MFGEGASGEGLLTTHSSAQLLHLLSPTMASPSPSPAAAIVPLPGAPLDDVILVSGVNQTNLFNKTKPVLCLGTTTICLENSLDIWQWITIYAVSTCALAYFIAGIVAARVFRHYTILWLPLVTCFVGGLYGLLVGAPAAYVLANMYNSADLPVSFEVAATFGTTIGLFVVYLQLGRNEGNRGAAS